MPRAGPLPKLNDNSGPPLLLACDPGAGKGVWLLMPARIDYHYVSEHNKFLPGGGGIFGGPGIVLDPGRGCCCNGGGLADGGKSFGSTSSHSEDRSPELNLKGCRI